MSRLIEFMLDSVSGQLIDWGIIFGFFATAFLFFIEYRNKNAWNKRHSTLTTLSEYATADFVQFRYRLKKIASWDILIDDNLYEDVTSHLRDSGKNDQLDEVNLLIDSMLFKFEIISGSIRQNVAEEKIVKQFSGNLLPTLFYKLEAYIDLERKRRKYNGFCEDMEFYAKRWKPKLFR